MDDLTVEVSYFISVDDRSVSVDDIKVDLLASILKTGSINGAAREVGISYRMAINYIKRMESNLGIKIVTSSKGGKNRGGTSVNNVGLLIIKECRRLKAISQLRKLEL